MKVKPYIPDRECEERFIGGEIRSINNLVRRFMDKKSHKAKLDEATCTNVWILAFLSECEEEKRDVYQRDIEKKFCVTRSTVSKVLSLMESKNLIERKCVSGDARLKKIVLTDKSREYIKLMQDDRQMLEDVLKEGLTEAEINDFCNLIEKVKTNLRKALSE